MFSSFGASLDPLDPLELSRGTTTGTFTLSVPTANALRGAGVAAGSSGTSRGSFKPSKVLPATLPPVSPAPRTSGAKPVPVIPQATLPKQAPLRVLPKVTLPTVPRAGGATPVSPKIVPKFSPSAAATIPGRSGRSGSGSSGSGSGSSGSGAGSGTTTPSWMSNTYVSNILGMVGWTGPSNYYPNVTYTVATTTLDGATAPVISVATGGTTTSQVLPTSSDWVNTASLVLAAKQAADMGGGSASGGGGGGGGGGRFNITDIPTSSGGSVWTDESGTYPTGEASTLAEQAQATVDAAATPTELVTEDTMTVSTDVAAAGEEGFFAKYKWWIAGGVGAAGVYAYLHRTDPSKYPLPEMLSKLVRA